jgi:beta-lactamase regulating signal transducer with metallopeptidase domain
MSAAQFGWTAIHFVWQGAGLALVSVILLRRSGLGARTRYAVGCAILLLMAVTPALTFAWLGWRAAADVVGVGTPSLSTPALTSSPAGATSSMSALTSAAPWIGVAWILGVLLCAVHLLLAWHHAQRIRVRARPIRGQLPDLAVPLLQSDDVDVPVALGCRRPVVVMPPTALQQLSKAELHAIIAHELMHIRRRDPLVNLAQAVLETLLFFHPGVWWLSRRIREDREHCCDEAVVRTFGQPLIYARALTRLEELRRHRLALASSGGALLARVRHITMAAAPRPRRVRVGFAVVLLAPLSVFSDAAVRASAPALALARSQSDPLMYIEAHDDAGPFTVSVRAGRVVAATVDGRAVPPRRLLQHGDSLRIISDDGSTSFTVRVRPDGIVWDARSIPTS